MRYEYGTADQGGCRGQRLHPGNVALLRAAIQSLRRGQFEERRFKLTVIEGTQHSSDVPVAVDQRESGLGRDAESGVDVPLVIADLRKSQRVAVDEVLE